MTSDIDKNLENYIKCLGKNIQSFQELKKIQQTGLQKSKIKEDIIIPYDLFSYYVNVWKLEAMKVVLIDLNEIITRQKEQEREEDNREESFWKEY